MKHFTNWHKIACICLFLFPFLAKAQLAGSGMGNAINIGTFGVGTFTYSNTQNNSTATGFGNNYNSSISPYGQPSDDIFYKVVLLGDAQINISHCGSGVSDTYMHLFNANNSVQFHNDDWGPLCSSFQASISTTVPAGTYYIVSEGWNNNNGNITTSVQITIQTVALNLNKTTTWLPQRPITNDIDILSNTTIATGVQQVSEYTDGFGRIIQKVARQSSISTSGTKDFVEMHEYDSWGREVKKYLPFVSNIATTGDIVDDGKFKTDAVQQLTAFGNNQYPGENYFYGQVNYENSPSNRTLNTYAAGNSWVGASRGVTMQYLVNTTNDNVRIWSIS